MLAAIAPRPSESRQQPETSGVNPDPNSSPGLSNVLERWRSGPNPSVPGLPSGLSRRSVGVPEPGTRHTTLTRWPRLKAGAAADSTKIHTGV